MRLWSTKPSSVSPWTDGLRFDPARSREGHVESWFLKANDPQGRRAIWLRWTVWAGSGEAQHAVAEAWAVAFGGAHGHVATKTSVPFDRARFATGSTGASIDGCTLTAGAARGRVESGGRAISYDLTIDALEAPLLHFPHPWMYERPFPRTKIVSPIPHARISGTVDVEGEPWLLEAWPGMVGHNWGAGNAESYAWGHCNAWDGEDDVVFEGFSARVRAAGVLLPMSTALCVRHHGTSYMLNGFVALARNHGSVSPRRWRFHGRGARVAIEGEMWADTEDFVGLFYPNPDGTMCYCLNSKLANAELTLRIEGRAPKTLRSRRAALELATRDPHHGVRMYV
jgi:Tocopherol cyclase